MAPPSGRRPHPSVPVPQKAKKRSEPMRIAIASGKTEEPASIVSGRYGREIAEGGRHRGPRAEPDRPRGSSEFLASSRMSHRRHSAPFQSMSATTLAERMKLARRQERNVRRRDRPWVNCRDETRDGHRRFLLSEAVEVSSRHRRGRYRHDAAASSEARKATTPAISSGSATRFEACMPRVTPDQRPSFRNSTCLSRRRRRNDVDACPVHPG